MAYKYVAILGAGVDETRRVTVELTDRDESEAFTVARALCTPSERVIHVKLFVVVRLVRFNPEVEAVEALDPVSGSWESLPEVDAPGDYIVFKLEVPDAR